MPMKIYIYTDIVINLSANFLNHHVDAAFSGNQLRSFYNSYTKCILVMWLGSAFMFLGMFTLENFWKN